MKTPVLMANVKIDVVFYKMTAASLRRRARRRQSVGLVQSCL